MRQLGRDTDDMINFDWTQDSSGGMCWEGGGGSVLAREVREDGKKVERTRKEWSGGKWKKGIQGDS